MMQIEDEHKKRFIKFYEILKEEYKDINYAIALRSWRNNWDELSTYFKYPQEIRTLIYTTNSMESYNRLLRKVTKSKSIFHLMILFISLCI